MVKSCYGYNINKCFIYKKLLNCYEKKKLLKFFKDENKINFIFLKLDVNNF